MGGTKNVKDFLLGAGLWNRVEWEIVVGECEREARESNEARA